MIWRNGSALSVGARVPGTAIVVLATTLSAVPEIPVIGLVLVLSVDWFVGIARAIGNCVATIVVAAWEGDIDRPQGRRALNGEQTTDTAAILDAPVAQPPSA